MGAGNLAEIERYYGADAAADWRLVLRHFELSKGFALIVLTVPDRLAAGLCHDDLASSLATRGQLVERIAPATPDDLGLLATTLLSLPTSAEIGAVWVESVTSEYATDHTAWIQAWRRALGSLNQQRNPLRRHVSVPLIFVGAPWMVTTMQEIAPDLWSVRAFVSRIQPMSRPSAQIDDPRPQPATPLFIDGSNAGTAPDPFMARRAAEQLRGVKGQERRLADVLSRMALGYASRGDWAEAEAAWVEVIQLRRQFGPPERAPGPLLGLAEALSEQGRWEEAIDPARQAVELFRPLSERNPGAYRPQLAAALNNLSVLLSHYGQIDEPLALAREVVAIRRDLAANNPQAYEADLAGSLTNLSNRLSEAGQGREALAAAEQAVAINRDLSLGKPFDALRANLAGALHTLSNRLAEAGRSEDAVTVALQAIGMWRDLVTRRPNAYRPSLAMALHSLANAKGRLGRWDEALNFAKEEVELYRGMVKLRPTSFRPGLASALNVLTNALGMLGHSDAAIAAAKEAVAIHRALVEQRSASFRRQLTASLSNLAKLLTDAGRPGEGLGLAEEAVANYRVLAEQNAGAHSADLTNSLMILADTLDGVGRPNDALAVNADAVRYLALHFSTLAKDVQPRMAAVLADYQRRCRLVGTEPDHAILDPAIEALKTSGVGGG